MNITATFSMLKNIFNGYIRLEISPANSRLFIVVPGKVTSLIEIKCDDGVQESSVGTLYCLNDISYPVVGRIVQNEKVCIFHGDRFTLEKEDGSVEKLFLYLDESNFGLSLFREADRESILDIDLHPSTDSLYPWMKKYARLFVGMVVKMNEYSLRILSILELNNPLLCGTFLECHVIYDNKAINYRVVYVPAAWAEFTGNYIVSPEAMHSTSVEAMEHYDIVAAVCKAESLKYGTSIDQIDWESQDFIE